jgi:hypothetical protein
MEAAPRAPYSDDVMPVDNIEEYLWNGDWKNPTDVPVVWPVLVVAPPPSPLSAVNSASRLGCLHSPRNARCQGSRDRRRRRIDRIRRR